MKQILFPILALLTAANVAAQDPRPYFEQITTQDGLSNDKVNCILQDERGFIWIGTDDGLNRYDGERFVVFRNNPGNPGTISGNIITGLLEDNDGIMWITTADGGLSRYDHRLSPGKQFRQYRHKAGDPNAIPTNIINALVEDRFGYLWLGSSGYSVLRFDKKSERFLAPVPEGTRTILSLCVGKNGMIWAGRQGGGLLRIDPADLAYKQDPRYRDLYAPLPHAAVTALLMDSRENLWLGSWDNVLYCYPDGRKKEKVFKQNDSPYSFANDQIMSFAEDSLGRIWMGGAAKGLHILDRKTGYFYQYTCDPSREGTIADDRINCIYIDRKGNVWIGTNKGISISNPVKQQFVQTFLPDKKGDPITIYSFFETRNNDLWIGTSHGLYVRKAGSGVMIRHPLAYEGERLHITSFFEHKQGEMYLGTDYSLFRYDPGSQTLQLLPEKKSRDLVMNPIIDSRVVSILKDTIAANPVLLVSPYGHFLAWYDLKQESWISRLDRELNIIDRFDIADNLVRKLVKTRDGTIWLATVKSGLGKWGKEPGAPITWFRSQPEDLFALSSNHVYDIVEDAANNLWVSTYGGGLHYFNTRASRFSRVRSSNNLTEGLAMDDRGRIWMISNGELQSYDPGTRAFTSFNLPDARRSGGVRGYIFKDSRGRLYVAGKGYFIDFHPDSIRNAPVVPAVQLTGFSILNKAYSHLLGQKEIRLRYQDNYFTIGFSAPCFSYGNKVNYAYMLEGFDREWVPSGTRREVSYSNLDGGTYTFKVKASGARGSSGGKVASVKIVIVPPFWKRTWFYAAVALLISGIVYGIYRYRIGEVLKRQAIRNRIAQDLHDNVGSTLSSISIYSQVAKIYQEKGQMDALYGTLEKISAASTEMVSEMNDTVWAINPRNDQMSVILQRMESFARSLFAGRITVVEFGYDQEITHINLNMQKRKNFYLIFKEAVNNAAKYAGCSRLEVEISQRGRQLILTIEDNGKGFDTGRPCRNANDRREGGNGLENMRHRAREMQGYLEIHSQTGKGTQVRLSFPIP